MPNNTNQQPNRQLSPDQAAAVLGLATRLSETLLKQQNPMQNPEESMQEDQSLETAEPTEPIEESQEPAVPDEKDAKIADLESKMELMKKEMETMVKSEISSLKDVIIDVMKDNG